MRDKSYQNYLKLIARIQTGNAMVTHTKKTKRQLIGKGNVLSY